MNKIYYEKPKHLQKKEQKAMNTDGTIHSGNEYGQAEGFYSEHNEIEDNYFQPSYQAQDYTSSGQYIAQKKGLKELISNGALIVLSVLLVINLCISVTVIADMNYSWTNDEESFWYRINEGDYAQLVEYTWINRFSDIRETDGLKQCYAVAEYFEAASLYKVAENTGNVDDMEKYERIMEEKLVYFDDIMYIAEDINVKLGIE